MDELDVKIFRALQAEMAVAPSTAQVKSSLRSIATRLGADDMTVNYRHKKLEESGSMSGWQLMVNPMFFGSRMMDGVAGARVDILTGTMRFPEKLIEPLTLKSERAGIQKKALL